jgi:hypothetical protein
VKSTRVQQRGRGGGVAPRSLKRLPDLLPELAPGVRPATRQETLVVGMAAVVAGFMALAISASHGLMLLYGDAVAHLAHARMLVDTNTPGLGLLGSVWLPLPHLLMVPFVGRMEWWQTGMAGAWPSLACYLVGTMGLYRLARRLMAPRWAVVAAAFFGLNANLLYLSSTAMTEPLFLALLVWIVLLTMELVDAVGMAGQVATPPRLMGLNEMGHPDSGGSVRRVTGRLLWLGGLVLAATMTRYDGWVLGAAVWCTVAWTLWKTPWVWRQVWQGFVVFTVLALAGPVFWFWYCHTYAGDWLDFLRGPFSAEAIDRKTSTPGAKKYWGWHDPLWSLMLYARTAQVDAAAWETGWLIAAGSLWASWKAWKGQAQGVRLSGGKVWLLLWLPLPFYVYSVSYGSVPIFIPQLYPHSYYNSRYGMEMLPVFAVMSAMALSLLVARFGKVQPLVERLAQPLALMCVVMGTIWMLHDTPLVLKEAMVNSRGRLAVELPLTRQLVNLKPGAPILMENSEYVGALQAAGIPLKQTIGPDDYYRWKAGLADPSGTAAYVITFGEDAMQKAVTAHPDGLTEMTILHVTGKPAVRVYASDRYRAGH